MITKRFSKRIHIIDAHAYVKKSNTSFLRDGTFQETQTSLRVF